MIADQTSAVNMVLQKQHDAMKRGQLAMWTIYDSPRDWPNGHIARQFEYDKPTEATLTGDLPALREVFARAGLVCLTRNPQDQPQIVETWI